MYRTMGLLVMAAIIPAAVHAENARDFAGTAKCVLARPEASGFSGVVAVTRDGVVSIEPEGLTGQLGSAPITAATRFNIGSAGKMFTAVAVAQLIDRGLVGLDDPVGKYVDGLTPEAAQVTIRQLLTHTSGLGNFFTPDAVPALQRLTAISQLKPMIAADRPRFAPGSRFDYSNTGFALLGLVVEKASGEAYGDYLKRHIFAPAAMTRTGLTFDAGDTAVGLSRGGPGPNLLPPRAGPPPGAPPQGQDGPARPAPEAALPATPAGGLYSTAADMTRFFQALASGKLLRPETVRTFTAQQVESAPAKGDLPALHYGFGFGTGRYENHAWFGHNGGAPGLNAEAVMFPDDGLIVVVLANRDPPVASQVFRSVRDALLKDSAGGCR